jgi:hypothetical protein
MMNLLHLENQTPIYQGSGCPCFSTWLLSCLRLLAHLHDD